MTTDTLGGLSDKAMPEPIHIISLGAGVQSSTMALMAAHGEITPMPIAAIFADTKAEPASVYRWLDWLERQLLFPVLRVSRGDLASAAMYATKSTRTGRWYQKVSVPVFIGTGMAQRQCTTQYKLLPIKAKWNKILSGGGSGVQWVGISTDEAHRAKDCRFDRVVNRFPLLEIGFSRAKCIQWMKAKGFPEPPKSACFFCPYRDNKGWLRMKRDDPESFLDAVKFENEIASTYQFLEIGKDKPFLHKSKIPLNMVDLSYTGGQLELFGNECEGMCGV